MRLLEPEITVARVGDAHHGRRRAGRARPALRGRAPRSAGRRGSGTGRGWIVDLVGTTLIDSTALGLIAGAAKSLAPRRRRHGRRERPARGADLPPDGAGPEDPGRALAGRGDRSPAVPRSSLRRMLLGVAAPPPLICLDPGHGTPPAIGGSSSRSGRARRSSRSRTAAGHGDEARGRARDRAGRHGRELVRRGYRVAMTRTAPWIRIGTRGNIARAQFCNRRHAALMLRLHADGSTDPATERRLPRSTPPCTPAGRTTSTRRAAAPRACSSASVVAATGAADDGVVAALGPDGVQLGERPGRLWWRRASGRSARGSRRCSTRRATSAAAARARRGCRTAVVPSLHFTPRAASLESRHRHQASCAEGYIKGTRPGHRGDGVLRAGLWQCKHVRRTLCRCG